MSRVLLIDPIPSPLVERLRPLFPAGAGLDTVPSTWFLCHLENDTLGEPVPLVSQRLRRFAQYLDEVAGWAAHRPPNQPPHP